MDSRSQYARFLWANFFHIHEPFSLKTALGVIIDFTISVMKQNLWIFKTVFFFSSANVTIWVLKPFSSNCYSLHILDLKMKLGIFGHFSLEFRTNSWSIIQQDMKVSVSVMSKGASSLFQHSNNVGSLMFISFFSIL